MSAEYEPMGAVLGDLNPGKTGLLKANIDSAGKAVTLRYLGPNDLFVYDVEAAS